MTKSATSTTLGTLELAAAIAIPNSLRVSIIDAIASTDCFQDAEESTQSPSIRDRFLRGLAVLSDIATILDTVAIIDDPDEQAREGAKIHDRIVDVFARHGNAIEAFLDMVVISRKIDRWLLVAAEQFLCTVHQRNWLPVLQRMVDEREREETTAMDEAGTPDAPASVDVEARTVADALLRALSSPTTDPTRS